MSLDANGVTVVYGGATSLWTKGGVGARVVSSEGDAVHGSRFSKSYWVMIQSALSVFVVAMSTPISVLSRLAIVDENGKVVLDDKKQPIRVFAGSFVPGVIPDGVSASDIVWSERESPE